MVTHGDGDVGNIISGWQLTVRLRRVPGNVRTILALPRSMAPNIVSCGGVCVVLANRRFGSDNSPLKREGSVR